MRWLRALEGAFELIRATLELRLRAASRAVALLGELQADGAPDDSVAATKLREAERVGGTVAHLARVLPWHPTCLRQALAVQRMLRRRKIPCRLHLGVTHPSVGTAHAWVTVAGQPVVGSGGIDQLVPLAAFG